MGMGTLNRFGGKFRMGSYFILHSATFSLIICTSGSMIARQKVWFPVLVVPFTHSLIVYKLLAEWGGFTSAHADIHLHQSEITALVMDVVIALQKQIWSFSQPKIRPWTLPIALQSLPQAGAACHVSKPCVRDRKPSLPQVSHLTTRKCFIMNIRGKLLPGILWKSILCPCLPQHTRDVRESPMAC